MKNTATQHPLLEPYARTVTIDTGINRIGYSTWVTRHSYDAPRARALYTHTQTWPTVHLLHDLTDVGVIYEPEEFLKLPHFQRRYGAVNRLVAEPSIATALGQRGASIIVETTGDLATFAKRRAKFRRETDCMAGAITERLSRLGRVGLELNIVELAADEIRGGRKAETVRQDVNLLLGHLICLANGKRNPKALAQDGCDAVAAFIHWSGQEMMAAYAGKGRS